jgi:hypothetical protein
MGSTADSRHPLKPLDCQFGLRCQLLRQLFCWLVKTGGGPSPSVVHPFTVQEILIGVPNWWCKCGHEPTSAGFCGIHGGLQKVGMILCHFCCE